MEGYSQTLKFSEFQNSNTLQILIAKEQIRKHVKV